MFNYSNFNILLMKTSIILEFKRSILPLTVLSPKELFEMTNCISNDEVGNRPSILILLGFFDYIIFASTPRHNLIKWFLRSMKVACQMKNIQTYDQNCLFSFVYKNTYIMHWLDELRTKEFIKFWRIYLSGNSDFSKRIHSHSRLMEIRNFSDVLSILALPLMKYAQFINPEKDCIELTKMLKVPIIFHLVTKEIPSNQFSFQSYPDYKSNEETINEYKLLNINTNELCLHSVNIIKTAEKKYYLVYTNKFSLREKFFQIDNDFVSQYNIRTLTPQVKESIIIQKCELIKYFQGTIWKMYFDSILNYFHFDNTESVRFTSLDLQIQDLEKRIQIIFHDTPPKSDVEKLPSIFSSLGDTIRKTRTINYLQQTRSEYLKLMKPNEEKIQVKLKCDHTYSIPYLCDLLIAHKMINNSGPIQFKCPNENCGYILDDESLEYILGEKNYNTFTKKYNKIQVSDHQCWICGKHLKHDSSELIKIHKNHIFCIECIKLYLRYQCNGYLFKINDNAVNSGREFSIESIKCPIRT